MNKKIKKTVIITGYKCNNMCLFCIDEDKRGLREKTTDEMMAEIISAKKRGSTYLEFIGGEVFIRLDILKLIAFASGLGFKTINIATNGRMLAYRDFSEKVVKAGLTDIIFSIHGYDDFSHDLLTGVPGSFKQLMKGFVNMKKILGIEHIGSNTTIVKQNYKNIEKIGKMIYGWGIRNSEFIFVDPSYGASFKRFSENVPRISEAAPYIRKCLDIGKEKKCGHWHIRYVPLCYFQDYLDQVSELDEVKKFNSEHLAPDFENFNVEDSRKEIGRMKTERCRGCKLFDKCEGIWREYVRNYGDKELIRIA